MTVQYKSTDWCDTLYNSVRKTPGGVIAAAQFLSDRREIRIHPESLRAKLRANQATAKGDAISVEMASLLSEWMRDHGGAEYAGEWIHALAVQHNMAVDYLPPPPPGGRKDEVQALLQKVLEMSAMNGLINSTALESLADREIDEDERDRLVGLIRRLKTLLSRAERNLSRMVKP